MFRIVLPVGIPAEVSTPASRLIRWAVPVPNVVSVATINIRIAVEIIVVVNVDVVVAPATAPSPTATPSRSDRQANSK